MKSINFIRELYAKTVGIRDDVAIACQDFLLTGESKVDINNSNVTYSTVTTTGIMVEFDAEFDNFKITYSDGEHEMLPATGIHVNE